MKSWLIPGLIGVAVGVVLANRLHSLPVIDKLPQL